MRTRTILLIFVSFACGVTITLLAHRPRLITTRVPSADSKQAYERAIEDLGRHVAEQQREAGRATFLFIGLYGEKPATSNGYPIIYEGCSSTLPVVNGVEVLKPFYTGYNGFLQTNAASEFELVGIERDALMRSDAGSYPVVVFQRINFEIPRKIDEVFGQFASRKYLIFVLPQVSGYEIRTAQIDPSYPFDEKKKQKLSDWIHARMDELELETQKAEPISATNTALK